MCGFLVTKNSQINKKIYRRGPDYLNCVTNNKYWFQHALLSLTGNFTPQPYEKDGIYALGNFEIYNHDYKRSDGENIIPLYQKYGCDFAKYLDGEFAIAIYDFNKNQAIFVTDPFASKPIYYNGWQCASYPLSPTEKWRKIPANTGICINDNGVGEWKIHDFDFNNQHKNTYDYWIKAFENAVKKRAKGNKGVFIGLSSGYDSGTIACELEKQGEDFEAYSIIGAEDRDIIKKRGGKELVMDKNIYDYEMKWLQENAQDFTYLHNGQSMLTDKAVAGLSAICRQGVKDGCRIYLSGQGADEIFCDYSKFNGQGELGGVYPIELKPWKNFFGNFQTDYLMKEEMVGGAHGVETRYPFLDKSVVQEFLWLSPKLKNRAYKAPIKAYLDKYDYPYKEDEKVGFRPLG